MPPLPHATCPLCGKSVAVRTTGQLREHHLAGRKCEGSAQKIATYPVVKVSQPYGPAKLAEEREHRPSANPERPELVKVVYLDSRTAAWISSTRILRAR
jgi:hypothetical protein